MNVMGLHFFVTESGFETRFGWDRGAKHISNPDVAPFSYNMCARLAVSFPDLVGVVRACGSKHTPSESASGSVSQPVR